MRSANPVKQAAAEALDSSEVRQQLQEAQEIAPPVEINYLEGGNPEKPIASNQTVSPKQAASDLSRFRENIGEQLETLEAQQIRDAIDQLRAGDAQEAPADPVALDLKVPQENAAPAQQQATQPGVNQAPTADDEVVKLLQSNPKLLETINREVGQHAAQAEQARQYYEAGLAQNAALMVGNIQARHPELRGVHPHQWGVVLQSLNQSNPTRAAQITQELEGTRNFFTQAAQAETLRQQQAQVQYQAYQQQQQRQWKNYADNEDAKYTEFEKTRPAAEVKAVRENVLRVLSSQYNMPEADFIRAYQTDPTARSAAMQKMAYEVTLQALHREGVASKAVPPPVPTVQRPGSPTERASASDYEFKSLNDKVNRLTGRQQIAAAAELVAARRRRG